MHEIIWALIGAAIALGINKIVETLERRKNKKSFVSPVDVQPPPVSAIVEKPPVATRTQADIDRDYIRHQRAIEEALSKWCNAYFAIDKSRSLAERFENEKKEKRLSEELKAERKAVEALIEEFKEATKRVESS